MKTTACTITEQNISEKICLFYNFFVPTSTFLKDIEIISFLKELLAFLLGIYSYISLNAMFIYGFFLTELLKVDIALHTKYYSFPKTDKIKVPVSLGRWFSWPILLLYIFIYFISIMFKLFSIKCWKIYVEYLQAFELFTLSTIHRVGFKVTPSALE